MKEKELENNKIKWRKDKKRIKWKNKMNKNYLKKEKTSCDKLHNFVYLKHACEHAYA